MSIPKTIQEALTHPEWQQAMTDDMTALNSNRTWTLAPSLPRKSIVGCQWVFIVIVRPNGQVDCLKACLVAKTTPRYLVLIMVILPSLLLAVVSIRYQECITT